MRGFLNNVMSFVALLGILALFGTIWQCCTDDNYIIDGLQPPTVTVPGHTISPAEFERNWQQRHGTTIPGPRVSAWSADPRQDPARSSVAGRGLSV